MKGKSLISLTFPALLLIIFFSTTTASGHQLPILAAQEGSHHRIEWRPSIAYEMALLTVSGPNDFIFQQQFTADETVYFEAINEDGSPRSSGSYTYEIQLTPVISAAAKARLATAVDDANRQALILELRNEGAIPEPAQLTLSGYLTIQNGLFLNDLRSEQPMSITDAQPAEELITPLDQVVADDSIIQGSLCVGFDCVNGESFGFDTIRLKENNIRIRAFDTSTSASFPTNDWQITFNDTSNGGANKFSIDDIDGGRTPFTLEAGAPSHSLYVDDGGRLGLGTSTPVVDAHIVSGNTPTVRLEQDGSSGFSAQTWDMAGNEANFFIRDATNGSALPFRIFPGAPTNSLTIEASTGDIGLGTTTPTRPLHITGSSGKSEILVQETHGTSTNRTLLTLENNGGSRIKYSDTGLDEAWLTGIQNNQYVISRIGSGGVEFLMQADGTVEIGAGSSIVFELSPSGDLTIDGTLSDASSRDLKENFVQTDQAVLDQLMGLPIYYYNYKTDDDSIQHVGPTAEDFAEIFNVGADNTHISPRDLAGVAVAAVKELSKVVSQKELEIEALQVEILSQQDRLAELEAQNADLEARLAALEAVLLSQTESPQPKK